MLDLLRIPRAVLPRGRRLVDAGGDPDRRCSAAHEVPLAGIAGDQQAALFGQACFDAGHGEEHLRHRLLPADEHRPRAAGVGQPPAHDHRLADATSGHYALEGAVFVGGAVVQWLRDGLGIIERSADVEALAAQRARRGRRVSGARLHRPRQPALGRLRARHDGRPVARHHARAHRARGARVDRLPERRGAARHAEGRRPAPRGTARRRRRDGERPADAVPGRPARRAGRAAEGHRDDRARRRLPRRARRRLLGLDRRGGRQLAGASARFEPAMSRDEARGATGTLGRRPSSARATGTSRLRIAAWARPSRSPRRSSSC